MKKFILLSILFISSRLFGQDHELPVTLLSSNDSSKPVIFYISGDGGWNNFSSSLAKTLNGKGYTVVGLNAKTYFWNKKTPSETASAISGYLHRLTAGRADRGFVFAGYSFGADVLPFIINMLPAADRIRIKSAVLLSPSASTDFEIHWTDLMGWDKKRNMDVARAINMMNIPKVLAISGNNEKEFPMNTIHFKNFSHQVLPGGHHFENNTATVAEAVIAGF